MGWPPQVGDPLPRAAECWHDRIKFDGWVLGRGHGDEWQQVFRVNENHRDLVWNAIKEAVAEATVEEVRDRSAFGTVCGVQAVLAIGDRSAAVKMSWHYATPDAAPRLVTAYPSP
jgi:hypothetical protein